MPGSGRYHYSGINIDIAPVIQPVSVSAHHNKALTLLYAQKLVGVRVYFKPYFIAGSMLISVT
jgi:hypothetical protein